MKRKIALANANILRKYKFNKTTTGLKQQPELHSREGALADSFSTETRKIILTRGLETGPNRLSQTQKHRAGWQGTEGFPGDRGHSPHLTPVSPHSPVSRKHLFLLQRAQRGEYCPNYFIAPASATVC